MPFDWPPKALRVGREHENKPRWIAGAVCFRALVLRAAGLLRRPTSRTALKAPNHPTSLCVSAFPWVRRVWVT